jgi:hypothetical protein
MNMPILVEYLERIAMQQFDIDSTKSRPDLLQLSEYG